MHIIRFHLQALDKSDWDLARELVRFLRTIDPDEMTGGSQDGGQMVTSAALRGMTSCPQSPPISAISAEEEISHLLGTLQGNFCVSLILLLWASTPITTSRVCVNVLGRTNQLESEKRILAKSILIYKTESRIAESKKSRYEGCRPLEWQITLYG